MHIASQYRELGLRTIPLEGKRALVPWRGDVISVANEWERKYPDANIGLLNDSVTIVDVDDMAFVDEAIARFGATPLMSKTRKGIHLWYTGNGERRQIRPIPDLPIDVLGIGGYTVVPCSIGYSFIEGKITDIPYLPTILPDALPIAQNDTEKPEETIAKGTAYPVRGERNNTLFRLARDAAEGASSMEDLADILSGINGAWPDPLPEAQVQSIARTVWGYREAGTLMATGSNAFLSDRDAYDRIEGNVSAMALYLALCRYHSARKGEFILANAMSKKLGMALPTFRRAMSDLVEAGIIAITDAGGRGKRNPRRARFL